MADFVLGVCGLPLSDTDFFRLGTIGVLLCSLVGDTLVDGEAGSAALLLDDAVDDADDTLLLSGRMSALRARGCRGALNGLVLRLSAVLSLSFSFSFSLSLSFSFTSLLRSRPTLSRDERAARAASDTDRPVTAMETGRGLRQKQSIKQTNQMNEIKINKTYFLPPAGAVLART